MDCALTIDEKLEKLSKRAIIQKTPVMTKDHILDSLSHTYRRTFDDMRQAAHQSHIDR